MCWIFKIRYMYMYILSWFFKMICRFLKIYINISRWYRIFKLITPVVIMPLVVPRRWLPGLRYFSVFHVPYSSTFYVFCWCLRFASLSRVCVCVCVCVCDTCFLSVFVVVVASSVWLFLLDFTNCSWNMARDHLMQFGVFEHWIPLKPLLGALTVLHLTLLSMNSLK